jgi:hypothetical protein
MHRHEAATGEPVVLVETGETFEALAARRAQEQEPVYDPNPINLAGFDVNRSFEFATADVGVGEERTSAPTPPRPEFATSLRVLTCAGRVHHAI